MNHRAAPVRCSARFAAALGVLDAAGEANENLENAPATMSGQCSVTVFGDTARSVSVRCKQWKCSRRRKLPKAEMNDIRQKFWTDVYLAYMRDPHYSLLDLTTVADDALRAFDERFIGKVEDCATNPDSTPCPGKF